MEPILEFKPWLRHYDEGVPETLQPYPECTLLDVVSETADRRPKHPALLFQGLTLSYGELERLSMAFASALTELGVKPGDRVALLLPNSPQIILSIFGTWKAGGVVVPLNPLYTERELEHALGECGAETVVVLTPFYDKVKAIQARTNIRNVIATNIKEFLPAIKRALFTWLKEKKHGHRIALQAGDVWLDHLLRRYGSLPQRLPRVGPADPAILLFSGGTTGTPKAALGTQHALFIAGMQIHTWFKNLMVDWHDVIMLNMPLFHAYGLAGVLTTGLVGHNTFALIPNPRDLNELLIQFKRSGRPSCPVSLPCSPPCSTIPRSNRAG